MNLLAPGEVLVYLEGSSYREIVNGTTRIARKIRDYIDNNTLWYELLLLTDANGDFLDEPEIIIAIGSTVLSEQRIYQDINPKVIYYFTNSTKEGTNMVAKSFVIKNSNKVATVVDRSGFGSGIYGRYIENPVDVDKYITQQDEIIYKVNLNNPYPLQDKEHGESLTVASLNTNNYLERIIQTVQAIPDINYEQVLLFIRTNESPSLLTLWNIVLYRTYNSLDKETFDNILANYVLKYLTDNSLVDSTNGEVVQELPINHIMKSLGYNGIIAKDFYNNSTDRGCVNYLYDDDNIIRGDNKL